MTRIYLPVNNIPHNPHCFEYPNLYSSRIASNKYGEAQPTTQKKKRFANENLEPTLIDVVKNEF